jgi:UDPglucose 6-dehydrogenase
MKIAIIGLGTVAMADALALGRCHDVVLTGPVPDRVDAINAGEYGLHDPCLPDYLRAHRVQVRATLDTRAALDGAGMVFISAPLALDLVSGKLQTVELESRIELAARLLPHVPIVIRSAVPIGFTEAQRHALGGAKLVYAPEFSRTGRPLADLLEARYLIVGESGHLGAQVGQVLASAAWAEGMEICQMVPSDAEATRHLSTLIEAPHMPVTAAGHGGSEQAEDGPFALQDFSLAKPFVDRDGQRSPACALAVQARLKAFATHLGEYGAGRVGVYISAPATSTSDHGQALCQRLEAFGLKTYAAAGGAGRLQRFKDECDLVITQHMTPDLMDITHKVFTRDGFVAV